MWVFRPLFSSAEGHRLHLRIAVDYSSRDAILSAARAWRQFDCGASRPDGAGAENNMRESFSLLMQAAMHSAIPAPDVDLLIRTGGEQRLSDFLLWECAYAELIFSRRMWPDFDAADLDAAVRQFHARQRRFGAIPQVVAPSATGAHAWLD